GGSRRATRLRRGLLALGEDQGHRTRDHHHGNHYRGDDAVAPGDPAGPFLASESLLVSTARILTFALARGHPASFVIDHRRAAQPDRLHLALQIAARTCWPGQY